MVLFYNKLMVCFFNVLFKGIAVAPLKNFRNKSNATVPPKDIPTWRGFAVPQKKGSLKMAFCF